MQADTSKVVNWLLLQSKVVSAVQADTSKLVNDWLPEQFKVVSAVAPETFKLVNA